MFQRSQKIFKIDLQMEKIYKHFRSNFHFVEEINLLDREKSQIWEIDDLVSKSQFFSYEDIDQLSMSLRRCRDWLKINHPECFL